MQPKPIHDIYLPLVEAFGSSYFYTLSTLYQIVTTLAEAETMRFISRNTTIPVPKVYRALNTQRPCIHRDGEYSPIYDQRLPYDSLMTP
ncbi:hypothetical protein TCAP_02896 [Tolypocladium capitatum]|uniref:Uncharacterized protein n=1 Tax=Tolypocladium capitatum TaxID=45235 RepID=A0A2K3QI40_9HYPO|nr:hypothetical protein TCAP_02896 [Tolypocladium capitatum]